MTVRRILLMLTMLLALSATGWSAGRREAAVAELPTLKWLTQYVTFDPTAEYAAEVARKLTGYTMEYHNLPAENPDQRLLLELASGVDYDIMRLTFAQYTLLSGRNILHPLDGLIETHGPNVARLLQTGDEFWQAVTFDGRITGIPGIDGNIDHQHGIGINSAYLDELGMDVPETLEEFEIFARAVRDELGVVPLTGGPGWMVSIIASAFGVSSHPFTEIGGEVVAQVRQERLTEYLSYMAKLYREGLIDPEWPVNRGATVNEKFATGRAAMKLTAWWELPGIQDALQSNHPDAEIRFIRPLVGPDGTQLIGVSSGLQGAGVIPRTAANPEHAMRWFNAIYDPDSFMRIYLGEEGIHYEVREDGNTWPIQPAFDRDLNNSFLFYIPPPGLDVPRLWQTRVRKNEILYAAFVELGRVPEEIKVRNPTAFAPQLASVSRYSRATAEAFSDWAVKVIAGAESIRTYDSIIAEWERLGGAEMEAEVRAWWADYRR